MQDMSGFDTPTNDTTAEEADGVFHDPNQVKFSCRS